MLRPQRNAFTLIEVLLVVILIGLIAAFAWPHFESVMHGSRLDESVMRTRALIGMCRAQAMNESRRYRITFQPDGTLQLSRQKDPLTAPEEYVLVGDGWAKTECLLENVWVAGVLALPDGPPPLNVQDDKIEFTVLDAKPAPMDAAFDVDFEPDGSSTSVRWDLRDVAGRGRELTLDGRLGRLDLADLDPIPADEAHKPAVSDKKNERNGKPMETETVSP